MDFIEICEYLLLEEKAGKKKKDSEKNSKTALPLVLSEVFLAAFCFFSGTPLQMA